jgi:phosphomannomutase
MVQGQLEMKHFIFDVDGTLTPSRQTINPEFKTFFNNFCRKNKVSLVTGSDKPKTLEQLGEDTYNMCHTVFNCNGSDVWQSKKNIYTDNWTLPEDVHEWLTGFLTESKFVLRTGLHFEHRPGMCNFSIVGRNATLGERKLYAKFDKQTNERNTIAKMLKDRFKYVDAKVGGETGIDISKKHNDKSQILKYFDDKEELYFFGDAMHPEGNDYPLKKVILDKGRGICYNIQDYKETWNILKDYD